MASNPAPPRQNCNLIGPRHTLIEVCQLLISRQEASSRYRLGRAACRGALPRERVFTQPRPKLDHLQHSCTVLFSAGRRRDATMRGRSRWGSSGECRSKPQMNKDFEDLAARASPAIFVVLWSTSFIGTKYVLHNAEPLTYLAIRMVCVVGLMAIIVAFARPRWPDRVGIDHSIVAGFWCTGSISAARGRDRAFDPRRSLGADSRIAADPDVDAGEPLARRTRHAAAMDRPFLRARWCSPAPARSADDWRCRLWMVASGASLVSITLGTLYQRRYCNQIDWRAGNLVQYVAVAIFFAAGACLFENNVVHWTAEFVLALAWLVVVLSSDRSGCCTG